MEELESRIKEWVSTLKKNPNFEESDIIEMENHFRKLIDGYLEEGIDEEFVFEKAEAKFGRVSDVANDLFKLRSTKKVPLNSREGGSSWMPLLLFNFFKSVRRNFFQNKFYTSLNLFGLTIGIFCCLLIILFVKDELSYDQHHEKASQIYRINVEFIQPTGNTNWAAIGPPVAGALEDNFPEVEDSFRFFPISGNHYVFKYNNNSFKAESGIYADSTLFDVFTFPLKYGDPSTALVQPGSIVISEEMATAYFGNEDPIGKAIQVVDWGDALVTVTGVFEKIPTTTHFPFNFALSMSTYYDIVSGPNFNPDNAITWAGFYGYLLLREGTNPDQFSEKLPEFVDSFYARIVPDGTRASEMGVIHLQPLTDIHLTSNLEKEYKLNSDIKYVYLFILIAIFVLLIACANFINLTTARAGDRMKEIGIKKTLGASRGELVTQFLGESIVLSLLALIIAYAATIYSLPFLNQITGKTFTPDVLFNTQIIISFIGISLFAGFLSGMYPALHMSGFTPAKVLKGIGYQSSGNAFLRKGLVVFQFTISTFLIIGTILVYSQMDYLRTKQLGFDKEGVIAISMFGEFDNFLRENPATVKEELLRNPDILHVSLSGDHPGRRFSVESVWPEGWSSEDAVNVRIADDGIDYDFIPTMGINLVEGRNFSQINPTDSTAWIINEAAVQKLNLENPVGHILNWGGYSGPIVGVAENFNYQSLHNEVEALVIPLRPSWADYLFVRVEGENISGALASIEEQIKGFIPGFVLEYFFLSEEFEQLYRTEDQMMQVFLYFSIIAILIACLGLFGLSTYLTEQRAKEIGIRKVLGASVNSLVVLVSANFLKLILVAFFVATPIIYFFMSEWLSSFAYKIDMSIWVFIFTGILVLSISLFTIGFQAIKTALANPVKSLRSE